MNRTIMHHIGKLALIAVVLLNGCANSSMRSGENSATSKLHYYQQVTPGTPKVMEYDIAVYGGTPAGVAAAIQSTRMGKKTALEIKVLNSLYNRVAGDQAFPGKKQYTKTNILLIYDHRGRPRSEIPLEPSGLLGPVTIQEAVY